MGVMGLVESGRYPGEDFAQSLKERICAGTRGVIVSTPDDNASGGGKEE